MSKANRFTLKFTGSLEDLRKEPAIAEDLKRRAEAIARAASENGQVEGYEVTHLVLEDPRSAVSVMATGHAHYHNRKNHALLRNLDKGGD